MEQKEKEEHWFMGYWSDKPLSEATRDAIQAYVKKYGTPPTIVLVPKDTPVDDLQPLPGMNYVVQAEPLLFFNNYLIGEIPNDDFEETICLESVAE